MHISMCMYFVFLCAPLNKHICVYTTVVKMTVAESPFFCRVIDSTCSLVNCNVILYLLGWHMQTESTPQIVALCLSKQLAPVVSAVGM